MVLTSFAPGLFSGLNASRKRRAIDQVPRPDLLETMNDLIVPGLFSRLDKSEPVGVVQSSFIPDEILLNFGKNFGSSQ